MHVVDRIQGLSDLEVALHRLDNIQQAAMRLRNQANRLTNDAHAILQGLRGVTDLIHLGGERQ